MTQTRYISVSTLYGTIYEIIPCGIEYSIVEYSVVEYFITSHGFSSIGRPWGLLRALDRTLRALKALKYAKIL